MAKKINELYALINIDPITKNEQVTSGRGISGEMPFIASKLETIKELKKQCELATVGSGREFKIYKYVKSDE